MLCTLWVPSFSRTWSGVDEIPGHRWSRVHRVPFDRELLNRGDEVCIIDDLSTGSLDNVKHLEGRPAFKQVADTVLNWRLMTELVDQADIVLHLAAAVGVRLIVESPVRTIETNIRGTEIVLSLAAEKRKPVVIFSTSEVYGKSSRPGFCETDDLILGPTSKGRWSYAASKIIDEFLALAYFKEKRVAGDHNPAVQHGGAAPDRALRDGRSQPG